jgi:eukaryotic-like serine/threonine-protein kinase
VSSNPVEALEMIDIGLRRVEEAIALEPGAASALESRGTIRYFRWLLRLDDDPRTRERLLRQAKEDLEWAVEFDPSRATAFSTLSHLRYAIGDISGAVIDARRAYEEDAYLQVANAILRRLYNGTYDLGQFAEAQRWCDEGGRRFPNDWRFTDCRLWLILTPAGTPDIERAWALREQLLPMIPESRREFQSHLSQLVVGGIIAQAGLADSASVVLETARAGFEVDPNQQLLGYEAAIRSIVGDTDAAIELLKRYVAANPGHDFEIAGGVHWWYQNLLSHPEFRSIRGG